MAAAFLPTATGLFCGSRVTGTVGALCPSALRPAPPPSLAFFPRRAATANGGVDAAAAAAAAARRAPLRASVAAPPPPAPLLPVPAAATHRATRGLRGVRPIHTALITGASGGIGAETVAALGQLYPDLRCLVVAVRDTEKARARLLGSDGELAANPRLAAATVLVQVELESVVSAVAAAEEAVAALDRVAGCGLDLFVANAGVMACPQAVTEDGFDKQMAINHLSHAAMTRTLLPALRAGGTSADGTAAGPGRAVFVSSTAALIASRYTALPLPNVRTAPTAAPFTSYKRWVQYGESKLANAVWAAGLAAREAAAATGVTAVSVHPGVVATELGRYLLPGWLAGRMGTPPAGLAALAVKVAGLKTPPEGAVTSVRAAVAGADALDNGAYYIDGNVKSGMLKMLGDPAAVGAFYDETLAALDVVSA